MTSISGKFNLRLLPKSDINRCPAIMFALSRTAKDIGRIRFLIDSIKTIKGISGPGVPIGTR